MAEEDEYDGRTTSWFRSKASNDKGRKKHVQSMMSRNGGAFRVSQINNNSYKISFRTRMGENSFTVLLDQNFPDTAPRLFCEARYSHPWLDANGNIVGLQKLNQWGAHSDLGDVVAAAAMQFVASPPTLKQQVQPAPSYGAQPQFQPVQPLVASQSHPAAPPSYQQHQAKQPAQLQRPASVMDLSSITISVPKRIEQVEALSAAQKAEMLAAPQLMEEFAFRELVSGLRDMRHGSQDSVMRVAKANLSKKEEMLAMDKEIQALREEVSALTTYYTEIKGRQDKELQKFDPPRLMAQLKQEAEESDAKTDQIKDTFDEETEQNKNPSPSKFTKDYIAERKKYHLLQIKKEKLTMLNLRRQ